MQNNSYYENIIIFESVRKWFYNNYFSNKSCFNLRSSGFTYALWPTPRATLND